MTNLSLPGQIRKFFILQKFIPKETTASSSKSFISSISEMVPSRIVTMGAGWEVSGVGISILTEGMVVKGVETIEGEGEMMEVGKNSIGWEEVEVACNSNDDEKIGEVERGVEIGMSSDTEGVPLVAERMWDKLISKKAC